MPVQTIFDPTQNGISVDNVEKTGISFFQNNKIGLFIYIFLSLYIFCNKKNEKKIETFVFYFINVLYRIHFISFYCFFL